MDFKLKTNPIPNPNDYGKKAQIVDLGNGSSVVYVPKFLAYDVSWEFFSYLDNHIPWTRPTIHVFGRSCMQPRDTCYVASAGLPDLIYSGYQPRAYSWDEFPPLKDILDAVHKILPGSMFNSLLLNRYKGGSDYIGWHSDDEKLYGSTPEIASVSLGEIRSGEKPPLKRFKKSRQDDQHRFALKHGSLLVMKGNIQRDWLHSVPKRAKAETTRINLTFRRVMQD
ncbi:Alpha-ketoglutarate-dependent dioxygenase alkB-like protein 2 [Hibiscus syriacus]|uniref:Alpha-ketoglutarate-dependent dioxygenase alkB-like protein 2 n=1 Tax=Hibiscus syriacus TaxID=106335 RepID=A0A6A3CJN9_HIBSY|nr:Alpha-ketoglutarate-dependent dioxygenase alkB-like protein 2 [Hibiscus syriacus]